MNNFIDFVYKVHTKDDEKPRCINCDHFSEHDNLYCINCLPSWCNYERTEYWSINEVNKNVEKS